MRNLGVWEKCQKTQEEQYCPNILKMGKWIAESTSHPAWHQYLEKFKKRMCPQALRNEGKGISSLIALYFLSPFTSTNQNISQGKGLFYTKVISCF